MLKPPEREQRQRLERSGPAPLDLNWERFGLIARELAPLFKRHWREIALNQDKVPLDPDWDRYLNYDLAGFLHCLTARRDGALAGYIFFFVHPHIHYASTPWAQTDIFWIAPEYRGGMTFIRMLNESEAYLKRLGAKVVYLNRKLHFDERLGNLFERKGYRPIELVYSKYLGD